MLSTVSVKVCQAQNYFHKFFNDKIDFPMFKRFLKQFSKSQIQIEIVSNGLRLILNNQSQ